MELFTLDRNLKRLDEIEEFESVIWTERYLGDGDVEMVVPATPKLTQKLFPGTFISLAGTNEIMVLDTLNIEDKKMKINGKSLLQWFNNRFVRTSDLHKEQTWYINDQPAGQILWVMIKEMATEDSTYLKGEIPIGIIDMFLQRLIVPELGLHSYDTSGDDVSVAVPFGPLYDAMREVAATYNIGMQIVRQGPEADHPLGFRSYRGLDRTSQQDENPIVRFSSFLESLANIKELQSNALEKNLIFTFAPDAAVNPFTPGISYIVGSEYSGFDLRAAEIFVEGGESSGTNVVSVLDSRAKAALAESGFVRAIDGDLLHTHQFQYGRDFGLGDLVEIVGTGGVAYSGRITEFIRSQDSAGEKGYPLYQSPQGLASASGEKGYPTVKIGGELQSNKPLLHGPPPPPVILAGGQGFFTAEYFQSFDDTNSHPMLFEDPAGFTTNDPDSFVLDEDGHVNILREGGYILFASMKTSIQLDEASVAQIMELKGIDADGHTEYGIVNENTVSSWVDENMLPGSGGYTPTVQYLNFFNLLDDYGYASTGTRPVPWPLVVHMTLNWTVGEPHSVQYSLVGVRCSAVGVSGDGGAGDDDAIHFDRRPQEGEFLKVNTSSYIELEAMGSGNINIDTYGTGSLNLYSDISDINVVGQQIVIQSKGDGGVVIDADGEGNLVFDVTGASDLQIGGLPTSDPGGVGIVWNDGGTLRIT